MLTASLSHRMPNPLRRAQAGVILVVALIVLVAMTLASLALVRSMDTANFIAGNLAFQQSALHSGDTGVETAISWLENNNAGGTLWTSNVPQGYSAIRQDPSAGQTWDTYWSTVLVPGGMVVTLSTDSTTGNTVSYVIHRLCNNTGDPASVSVDCAQMQSTGSTTGSSKGAGFIALQYSSQVYYRITSRIAGPHNTVSFIQAIVAL